MSSDSDKGRRGRPKGLPKTGGRKKGTPNKATLVKYRTTEAELLAYIDSPLWARDFARLKPVERMNICAELLVLWHVRY